jgi:hypothetical protein
VILKTRAGRENNIFIVPSAMLLRPSPRLVDYLGILNERLAALARRQKTED